MTKAAGGKARRKSISKKIRFEVFKRDNFACQYCGASAPDVVLHVDHIEPVAKGGDNDILNLITACAGCNAGKSDRRLDDQSTLAKQRQQIADLNERREQLEMMVAWRKGMKSIKDSEIEAVAEHWKDLLDGEFHLNPTGLQTVRRLVRKFGASAVMDGMAVAVESYVKIDAEGEHDAESVQHAFRKVGGVCAMTAMPEDKRRLYYIRAIVRNRMYCNEVAARSLLEDALAAGALVDDMERAAKQARNWSDWQEWMADLIADASP